MSAPAQPQGPQDPKHLRGEEEKHRARGEGRCVILLPSKPFARQLFPATALTTGASWPDQRETLLWKGREEPPKLCSEG